MIIEEILDHAIKFKGKMFLNSEKQLPIYIRSEGGVGKQRVVKAIEMGFILLSTRRKKLMISAPTSFAANGIGRSTMYIALGIKN